MMYPNVKFPAQPALGIQQDGQYVLLGNYIFNNPKGSPSIIIVPDGFIYDGASVPRLAWGFMPPDGLHRAAALIHDFIYVQHERTESPFFLWSRKRADDLFFDIMVNSGVSKWRAKLAYIAVRMGGAGYWRI